MRWVAFILLVSGALFCASAFAPVAPGQETLLRPFVQDAPPILSFAAQWTEGTHDAIVLALAAAGALLFAVSLIGLFSSAIPEAFWPAYVWASIVVSLPLYILYVGKWMIAPIGVDVALGTGLVAGAWKAGVTRMRALQSPAHGINPLMRVPVPWVFVLGFLIGIAIHFVVPIRIDSAGFQRWCYVAGAVLLAVGVALAGWSLGLFKKARTTTIPYESASTLVTHGPYRFSRNPMYVSLTMVYLGSAGLWHQMWPLAILPIVLFYIHRVVIPVEESKLREVFGDAYVEYCTSVRRWV